MQNEKDVEYLVMQAALSWRAPAFGIFLIALTSSGALIGIDLSRIIAFSGTIYAASLLLGFVCLIFGYSNSSKDKRIRKHSIAGVIVLLLVSVGGALFFALVSALRSP